jgi:3-phenylpropionate/cinnamic acid dioxygenase small subunit
MTPWYDALAIRDVIDRYAAGIDRRDWDMLRNCFTADCKTDYGRSGQWQEREPFVAWLDEIHRDVGPTMHRMSNHQIDVDGDGASATSYLDALLRVEHRGFDLLHVVATYTDELVRTDEGWKIASRRVDDFLWRRESTTT